MSGEEIGGLILLGKTEAPRMEVPANALGPAGIRGELHVLAIASNEQRSESARLNDKTLRSFKVFGRLSKVPAASADIQGDFSEKDGGSYFLAPKGTQVHRVDTSYGRFYVHQNNSGEMSMLLFECNATDVSDAQTKFATAAHPFLDHLAYVANVPVHIVNVRIEDLTNQRTTITFTSPYMPRVVGSYGEQLALEMQPVYSMYREAKNATSDFYRFLCFYKLLEGLLGKMRTSLHQRASADGIKLKRERELVPDSPEYSDSLKPHVGTPIKRFFDDILTPEFRNAMAHFATDDGVTLNMSNPAHQTQYANIMLIMELCVRTVIQSHESMLHQLA